MSDTLSSADVLPEAHRARALQCPFVMDDLAIRRIHDASLELLDRVGVFVRHEQMKASLAAAGCRIDGDRVRMPGHFVTSMVTQVPPAFTLWSRDETSTLTLDGRQMYACNTGAMPNIRDLQGIIRPTRLQDVRDVTRLCDALPNIHLVTSQPVVAQELPAHTLILESLVAVVENSAKPQWLLVTSGLEARYAIRIGAAIRGNLADLRQRPFFFVGVCPMSPLAYTSEVVDAILSAAEAGLPVGILPAPIMGLTCPVTVAGSLAQINAEVLAGVCITQLVRPGCPMIRLGVVEPMDPRTAIVARGSPALGLTRIGYTQLSQFYRQPFAIAGLYGTSAKSLDYQAGYEKAFNGLMSALLRPHILAGAGGLAGNLITSLECHVIDNELLGMLNQLLQGFGVDRETLGVEAVRQAMDAGETFLVQRHTLRHLRSGQTWTPELADWSPFAVWLEQRQPDLLERARQKAKTLLATHCPPGLSAEVSFELQAIITEAERKMRETA